MKRRGHANGGRAEGNPKITLAQVETIRAERQRGATYEELARKHGLQSRTSARNIVKGITWKKAGR
jgi:hypothetical protein